MASRTRVQAVHPGSPVSVHRHAIFSINERILLIFLLSSRVSAEDYCKPATWNDVRELGDPNTFAAATPWPTGGRIERRKIEPGEINYRQRAFEQKKVNYHTCTK